MRPMILVASLLMMSGCAVSPSVSINLPENERNQVLALVYSSTECRVKRIKQLDAETIEAEAFSGTRTNGLQEILTLKKVDGRWVLKDKESELFCPG